MSNLEIKKVRWKGERVRIEATEVLDGEGNTKEIVLDSDEAPDPALPGSFKRLPPHIREILELPADWCPDRVDITSVRFSRSEAGVVGASMSGTAYLDRLGASFNFTTPHLPFEPHSDGSNKAIMPAACSADLDMLKTEALGYFHGRRESPGLFDAKSAAAGERREDDEMTLSINGGPAHPMSVVKEAVDIVKRAKRNRGTKDDE